jgi:hypothetical protein
MFLLVTDRDDFWIWGIGGLLVFSFGLAMLVAPITSTALKSAPSEFAGIASAVNNSVSRIGSLCSVAIIGLVVQRVFERNDGTGTPLEPTSTAVDHAANVDAFRAGMLVAAVLAFAGAIVGAAWISNREARASDEPVSEPAPVPAGGS